MLTEEKIQSFFASLMRISKHDPLMQHVEAFKTRYLRYLSALANNQPFDSFSILKDHLNFLNKQEYFFADYLIEIVKDIDSGGNEHQTLLTEDPEIFERIKTIVSSVPVALQQLPQHIQTGRSAAENRLIKAGPTKKVLQQVFPKVGAAPQTPSLSQQLSFSNIFKKSTSAVRETLSGALEDLIRKETVKKYPVFGVLFDQQGSARQQSTSKKHVKKSSLFRFSGSTFGISDDFSTPEMKTEAIFLDDRSLHHANVLSYRQKCMRETLQAFAGRKQLPLITETFIRQNWHPCSTDGSWDGFSKEALIYLVTGQPAGGLFDDHFHGKLKPLPSALQQDPVAALDNMSNLDDRALTVLCRLFGHGMRGHHLRSWMQDSHLQFMMPGYCSAILALVEKQNTPVEEALERTKGVTEDEAWGIFRSANNERQAERAFSL